MKCIKCGSEYEGKHGNQKYCSVKCRRGIDYIKIIIALKNAIYFHECGQPQDVNALEDAINELSR